MSKVQQLITAINAGNEKSSNWSPQSYRSYQHFWPEAELIIQRMKPADLVVTYDKDTVRQSPLLMTITSPKAAHLAILIIKKNPVFAAEVISIAAIYTLNIVCDHLWQEDAFEIVNSLIPYLPQEAILSGLEYNQTFLHSAVKIGTYSKKQSYKVAGAIPPKLISIILKETVKNCDELEANISVYKADGLLIEYLYEAINVYDMEISLHPARADNYFRKGVILQGIGKNEKALKCYKKAIKIDPSYAEKIEIVELTAPIEQELDIKPANNSKKITEEHKGERGDDAPPYEPPSQEEMALMGVEDTCNVTFHA